MFFFLEACYFKISKLKTKVEIKLNQANHKNCPAQKNLGAKICNDLMKTININKILDTKNMQ